MAKFSSQISRQDVVFYNDVLRIFRELEGNEKSQKPIPTISQSLIPPFDVPESRSTDQQNQEEAGNIMRSPNQHDITSQTHHSQKECRAKLLELLTNYFDENELKTLCFHLNIVVYDDLPASGKINKARELITFLERRHQVIELLEYGRSVRPDISWPLDGDCT